MSLINYPALLLNADFTPVNTMPLSVWGFERTMRNVFKGSVIILEEYDSVLRSQNLEYKPPSVVALKSYVKKPQSVPFTRMNIFIRDDFCCQYCGKKFRANELTFDHVIPRSKGGISNFENIVSACSPCNSYKGSRGDIQPIRKPYAPKGRKFTKLDATRKDFHKSWMDYLYWSGILEE